MSANLVLRIKRIASLGACLIFAFGVHQSAGVEGLSGISSMSIDELKSTYLGCEQAATTSRLNGGDAMYCSMAYEELKKKAFGGEFRRINSWLDRNCPRCSLDSENR